MVLDLYWLPPSPPCRAVVMVGKELGLEFNYKIVNVFEKEQLKPEYLEINPTHTIPTLVDDGFNLWESRAIMAYLCNKYGGESSLYPKCPAGRACVDRMLQFDMGTLYKAIGTLIFPQILAGAAEKPEDVESMNNALQFLETFLTKTKWVACDKVMTIADLSIFSSLTFLEAFNFDLSKFEKVSAWMTEMKKLPYHEEVNEKPLQMMKAMLEEKKAASS